MSGDIYIIVDSFSATLNGSPHIFRKGDTVREGHEVFESYRGSLKLIKPTYEHTPEPPPPAPKVTPPPAPVKKAVPPPAAASAAAPATVKKS